MAKLIATCSWRNFELSAIIPFRGLNLIPFGDFTTFLPLVLVLIPTVILGWSGRTSRGYNLFASIFMIYCIWTSASWHPFAHLYLIFFWQWVVIKSYSIVAPKIKYTVWAGFFYGSAVIGTLLPLLLERTLGATIFGFLGISYLTFKCTGMIPEIRDGLIDRPKFVEFTNFILFYPVLSSGPIDRYRRFVKDLQWRPSGIEYQDLFYHGIRKIFRGFFYKFIIAFLIKHHWLDLIPGTNALWPVINYMYAYSMYLFFDFAGYSAFAVGISYLLAVRTPENFAMPYISSNIKDFWTRWHISLSTWFRDYVYMRLILYFTRKKIKLDKYILSFIGYYALFGLMGLWHGFTGFYIIYGFYHAILMCGFDLLERLNRERHFWGASPAWKWLAIFATFHFVCFGFLIFSGRIQAYNRYLIPLILLATVLIFTVQIIKARKISP